MVKKVFCNDLFNDLPVEKISTIDIEINFQE